jgi:hypothetical protein
MASLLLTQALVAAWQGGARFAGYDKDYTVRIDCESLQAGRKVDEQDVGPLRKGRVGVAHSTVAPSSSSVSTESDTILYLVDVGESEKAGE